MIWFQHKLCFTAPLYTLTTWPCSGFCLLINCPALAIKAKELNHCDSVRVKPGPAEMKETTPSGMLY